MISEKRDTIAGVAKNRYAGSKCAEIPDLESFTKTRILLGLNLPSQERSQIAVSRFIKEYMMTYPVLMDKNGLIAELYSIQPIPTSYLIDTNGRIFNKALGALNYD